MKIVINTNVASPHTVPLALALADIIGEDNLCYVYNKDPSDPVRSRDEYAKISRFAKDARGNDELAIRFSKEAEVLVEQVRDLDVMEDRSRRHRCTFYVSERWFKPVRLDSLGHSEYAKGRGISCSGFLKMLFPFAIRRASRMMRIMRAPNNNYIYLANGIHAARDMARMCGLMNGVLSCIFKAPSLSFENVPGGRVYLSGGAHDARFCLDKIRMWGYFVEPAQNTPIQDRNIAKHITALRVLWVGRLLSCKRVDTIIRAIIEHKKRKGENNALSSITFDIYGAGPEECRLKQMAIGYEDIIRFHNYLSLDAVRKVMREHDVYVLSSDSFEGWGAVVNEALEEGMKVVGTYEAGASATILPESNLFHAGDWRALVRILENPIHEVSIGAWSVKNAAANLVKIIKDIGYEK